MYSSFLQGWPWSWQCREHWVPVPFAGSPFSTYMKCQMLQTLDCPSYHSVFSLLEIWPIPCQQLYIYKQVTPKFILIGYIPPHKVRPMKQTAYLNFPHTCLKGISLPLCPKCGLHHKAWSSSSVPCLNEWHPPPSTCTNQRPRSHPWCLVFPHSYIWFITETIPQSAPQPFRSKVQVHLSPGLPAFHSSTYINSQSQIRSYDTTAQSPPFTAQCSLEKCLHY